MLDQKDLQREVKKLLPIAISGVAYRYINLKYLVENIDRRNVLNGVNALSAIGSKKAGGRYNISDSFPKEAFEALYLADTSENALKEVEAMAAGIPIRNLRIIMSVDYKLNSVIDLMDTKNHQILGTNLVELNQSWRVKNSEGKIALTQRLGKIIYDQKNIEAIKVPSSKVDGAYNLVIFPNKLSSVSYVRVCDEDKLISEIS